MNFFKDQNDKNKPNLTKTINDPYNKIIIDAKIISQITHLPLSDVKNRIQYNNLNEVLNKINSKQLSDRQKQKLKLLFEFAKEFSD